MGFFLPGIVVLVAAEGVSEAQPFWLKLLLALVAWGTLSGFFVQKYPKTEPLKWIMRSLNKGEVVKIELEGK